MSVPYCTIDADCDPGYECIGGVCVLIGGGGGIDPPTALPGLGSRLRPRYTSNFAVTETMSAKDCLYEVAFTGFRGYMVQSANGKLGLKNKKPAPFAYGTSVFTAADTTLHVDSVTDWIGDTDTLLLVAPHTTNSEVHTVTGAVYPTSQNSITFSRVNGNTSFTLTLAAFSGCDGASTPATATITVGGSYVDPSPTAIVGMTLTLEGTDLYFIPTSADTTDSIASYIAGVIRTHPALLRRFTVTCASNVVTLVAKYGNVTVSSGLVNTTTAPIANPTTAPTLAGASGGSFVAGDYQVTYADVTASGETLLAPYKTVTLTANQKINVSALTLVGTSRNWYCSPEAGSTKLRFIANTNGSAFSITTLPTLNAQLPPDLNTTGCEVMKVSAVFSDRAETRSGVSRSNVQKASFAWFLGSREDTVNEIQLKYRDASRDWQLVTLKLKDEDSIAKIKATKPKEINGQAIDNIDQAYRIAAGLLSEKRLNDFFYKWTANRQALLLQEGDVVAITDDGSGVYNLPVFIEQIEFNADGVPSAAFTARKYTSLMYDDSVAERAFDIVSEAAGA